jgi:Na+/melibiose symporter-like transporter
MFFSGLLSSLLGWFVFKSLEESPFFNELQQQKAATKTAVATPVKTLFSSGYRSVLLTNLLITFGGGAGYLTSGYLPTFLKVVNSVPNNVSSLILMGASVTAFVSAILIGALSEKIGRKPTFLAVGVCALVLLPMCYLGLAKATDTSQVTMYAMAIAFIGNAGYAPVLIFLNERFPTALRASGTGLSWNIGFALGGMMPTLVSLASTGTAQIPMSLAIFSAAIFVVYLIGGLIIPETRGNFH